jgi:circadian clock protein KaiC
MISNISNLTICDSYITLVLILENVVSTAPPLAIKSEDRVPTGIKGLDEMIEGGFPRGSMILLAGSPGSGKTIASAQYLYHGASDFGENGVYISFVERESVFLKNMEKFGLNFERLKNEGKFKFLDMITPGSEAFSVDSMNLALKEVQSMKAQRLVIDSFTAISSVFDKKAEARIVLHLLEVLMLELGCTTLLVVEVPTGHRDLGLGFEEFIADGLILFETAREKLGVRKRAIISKMRGTNHSQNYCNIVISNQGFSLVPYVT